MIDARDLARAGSRQSTTGAATGEPLVAVRELERFYSELSSGLKRLLDAAEASRSALSGNGSGKRRGRPPGSKNKPKAAPTKAVKKAPKKAAPKKAVAKKKAAPKKKAVTPRKKKRARAR